MSDIETTPNEIALFIAGTMQHLGNGRMATLRRLDDARQATAYWHLAARHAVLGRQPERWGAITRALALLTPKGPPGERADLHDRTRKLGWALCDGGRANWQSSGADSRPLLSELRLARLLVARGAQRRILLTRAVRMLAATRNPHKGIDVGDLAWAFLSEDAPGSLAGPYYQCLDGAHFKTEQKDVAHG